MTSRISRVALGTMALALAGCAPDTHVSIERERVALSKQWRDTITATSNMKELAETAPQLEALAARLEKLAARKRKLAAPTAEEMKAIQKSQEKDEEEHGRAILAHLNRFGKVKAEPDQKTYVRYWEAKVRYAKAEQVLGLRRLLPGEGSGRGGSTPEAAHDAGAAAGGQANPNADGGVTGNPP